MKPTTFSSQLLLLFANIVLSTAIPQMQPTHQAINNTAPQPCQNGALKCHGLGRIISHCTNNNWETIQICPADKICEHTSTIQCVPRNLSPHQAITTSTQSPPHTPAPIGNASQTDIFDMPFCYFCNYYKKDCLDMCYDDPNEPGAGPNCSQYCTEVACDYVQSDTGNRCGARCSKSLGC